MTKTSEQTKTKTTKKQPTDCGERCNEKKTTSTRNKTNVKTKNCK